MKKKQDKIQRGQAAKEAEAERIAALTPAEKKRDQEEKKRAAAEKRRINTETRLKKHNDEVARVELARELLRGGTIAEASVPTDDD